MSNSHPDSTLPLWVQDRDTVIANDTGVIWRDGNRPDYSENNQVFQKESKRNHVEGSLEAITQNLVRTFELEASNKTDPHQWLSVVSEKFRMSTNGGPQYTAQEISERGTYNLFLGDTEHYKSSEETFESSWKIVTEAFPKGFLWEVIEVLAGPPKVVFKWRHWGTFIGKFKDYSPTGETIEIVGITIAHVNEELKLEAVEHFFDNSEFLHKLTAGGCPFH
ncbi:MULTISPECIES: SnoaL-like polyketide cyclase [Planktothricoides]|uniref:SnoaL-like polyketide cyclase n=2 Tax=Planktothricoides raciborskii TaxID=132608 RepID=A0AAU8JII8_9CYAN|nr:MULTISPECIES: SnoaL-like polyketide cyclase [Planktothricoides]KOR36632.1 SnoaL-like polyketide cyclase [Planktothricoides sp. SR001]MBD2546073.1 SnoaL-like polyketide cyclase [Planktothricoides raciborskii FACHB-1370]MBD2584331.1 SnoaL-like polyketide cyclase [Planktothricoides raciborskii FACHB-1261]